MASGIVLVLGLAMAKTTTVTPGAAAAVWVVVANRGRDCHDHGRDYGARGLDTNCFFAVGARTTATRHWHVAGTVFDWALGRRGFSSAGHNQEVCC